MKYLSHLLVVPFLIMPLLLIACSSSQNNPQADVRDTGKVIAVRTVQLPSERINPLGNVGVSAGSGGHAGIYASVDFATIGRVFRNTTQADTEQQIMIKKASGETIAITQAASNEKFKVGDTVKVLMVDGRAKVIH